MKIVIAGGSGFIGTYLSNYFAEKGNEVIILSRKKHVDRKNISYILWDGKTLSHWVDSIESSDIVINLAGKSVNCRYNEKNKREILDSRIHATSILGLAIKQSKNPPELFINAASATIYRDAYDHPQDEINGETGSDFSMDVCKAWEKCFSEFTFSKTRKIILRIAITLGIEGGVILRFKNLVRFGLGGKMYHGKQMMSWVHVKDIARVIEYLYLHEHENGVFNVSSPNPVTNKKFMKAIRKAMHIPFGIPTPKWFLQIGAFIIGTEIELIIKSRWVIPKRLTDAGFQFEYDTIEKVAEEI